MTRERWRLTAASELYLVSDLGRVRKIGGKILKPWPNSRGYLYVDLGSRCRGRAVHRLVCEAFVARIPAGDHVDHLDFDRTNNAASNLRPLHPIENSVRWAARVNGRNVWETPDDLPDEPPEPLTPDELAELAADWTEQEPAA